ncbi:MAG: M2 family metallopeptidase [bacterium]|nr:M2 family metallopeptidase [bacterium]
MQPRTLAGLGMAMLAAGVMSIWYLNRGDGGAGPEPGHDLKPAPATVAPLVPALVPEQGGPEDVAAFLTHYNDEYRRLWTAAEGAKFAAESDIGEANTRARIEAGQALGGFVGSAAVIEQLEQMRGRADATPLQERQLDAAWRLAAHYPAPVGERVGTLITTEAQATDSLYAGNWILRVPGRPERVVTPNQLDDLVAGSRDLVFRQAAWECSKDVGPRLKDLLVDLQGLRNGVAREMGYSSYFALETDNYGLGADEMLTLMDELVAGIMPLYQQLHCWTRHELAARYGEPVPKRIPAHWLDNRYGQAWPGIVEGVDMDRMLRDVQPSWLVEQAERFYVSMGFPSLPPRFWSASDLYELPPDATRRKNTHASAWHVDLDQDVRALMSVKADFDWFSTTHHELGHVYYYLAYSRPEVPPILREGANRAFHEGIGTLIELAAGQVPYLEQAGLLAPGEAPDEIRWLLNQALTGPVTFLPFACGTMTHWEYDLYEKDLPRHLYNTRWWEYAARYQGLEPPTPRGEQWCDAATKTHVIDDPAQYYDYAISEVILHQLHRYICREILAQDVHAANYYGSRQTGQYLDSILRLGATRDWAQVMREATGEDLSSAALLEYFAPLQAWLEKENAGRDVTF